MTKELNFQNGTVVEATTNEDEDVEEADDE